MTTAYLVYGLIAANVLFSWQAFENHNLLEQFKFRIGSILSGKEYIRMLSSGFLHVNWMHLIVNMIALYFFGQLLGTKLSWWETSIVYFVSLLAGNLLALFYNSKNYNYSAVGASGAVSGIVFACILFYPNKDIYLYFLIPIPAWIFGILYLLYTVYGMNQQSDNIGHEAHLGGALAGLVLAIAFVPSIAFEKLWLTIILFVIPLILFFVKPKKSGGSYQFKMWNEGEGIKRTKRSVDDLYYNKEFEREKELNALLEKVNENGLQSLSKKEQQRLEELSK